MVEIPGVARAETAEGLRGGENCTQTSQTPRDIATFFQSGLHQASTSSSLGFYRPDRQCQQPSSRDLPAVRMMFISRPPGEPLDRMLLLLPDCSLGRLGLQDRRFDSQHPWSLSPLNGGQGVGPACILLLTLNSDH
ncbi:hypothetical protein CPSG_05873 [Coccidioides posadasii str. Silveira]|uniref:Uncharacterized protein n=1 Tax=Coccidioides posadasii (strain RMSCC 757 / Silveira) TaxID=443226 RepID=E9D7S1_COCPS|nr:hypothetical protein CPSG_05873 [Coccidioides posadasii str. Silveira]